MKLPLAIAWEDVVNHPEVVSHDPIPFLRMERIGDASANGGREMVIVVGQLGVEDDDHSLAIYVDGELRDFASMAGMEYGHARVEPLPLEHRTDDSARVVVRTPSGEYSALPMVPGNMDPLEIRRQMLEVFACLYQRGRVTRDTALALPVHAGALQRATSAGRTMASRVDALVQRIRTPKLDRKAGALDRVTVELAAPKGTRAMALRLSAEHPVLPSLTAAPRSELPLLVGEALARHLEPRGYQALMAGMALVYQANGVQLDPDTGELPKRFRLDIMDTIGMPSRTASKAQRGVVQRAVDFLLHVEVMVKEKKTSQWFPLLVPEGYHDAPGARERRVGTLHVNRQLLGDVQDGACWRVPRALFQVGDDIDPSGAMRMMGFQLAHRLGMGTRQGSERLELLLRRAGLDEWCRKESKRNGPSHVLGVIRQHVDTLRSLPWEGHAPADIVGGVMVRGDTLRDAVVEYVSPPAWTVSSA
jgi:hypothetical protein